jgi:hypothetical protein
MPALCHTRTHAEDHGVVSQRSDWDADHLQLRLQTELSVGAWGRLSTAATRAGMDVEGFLQRFLEAR